MVKNSYFYLKKKMALHNRSKGNVLLVVIIIAALMALGLSLAFQPLRVQKMRQKEDLLIYRGEHLAKGIRAFYFRFGHFPRDLEDLIEVEPRLVRQVYQDPMTESGEWELMYLGKDNLSSAHRLKEQYLPSGQQNTHKSSLMSHGRQIIGIRSKSTETGYREYQESRIYNDWLFSAMAGRRKRSR